MVTVQSQRGPMGGPGGGMGGFGGGMRERFMNMSEAERREGRERYMKMSEAEREKFRAEMRERMMGGGRGPGGGRRGGR